MRRHAFPFVLRLAIVGALGLSAGCSAEQAGQTAQTFKAAKVSNRSANASTMAGSAVAAQSALYHLASALSESVSKDAADRRYHVAQAGDQPSYTVDLNAGTGKVLLQRDGEKAIELDFRFAQESRDGGKLYNITSLRGTTEGFQVLLPRLVIAYSPAFDDQGKAVKDAKGDTVFNVSVKANGFLGVDDQAAFQIADLTFGVRYPFPAGETKLGTIKLFSPEGMTFQGEAYLKDKQVSAKGQVLDAAGAKLFDLTVGADAKATLTPAS